MDEIRRYLRADTLGYLSLEGLIEAVHEAEVQAQAGDLPPPRDGYCHACFSGNYPVPFAHVGRPRQLRLVNA